MESTLHSEHGESYRDLALQDAHVRNKKARVHLQELGMGRSHKGPFAADLRVWRLEQDRFDKGEEEGSLGCIGHKDGYNAVVGLGRSPAILRGSPHFQAAPKAAIDALEGVGGGAQARGICDDGKMDVVLLPAAAPRQLGVADWRFEVATRNPRDRSRQGIPRSSCRLALQRGRNTRDRR